MCEYSDANLEFVKQEGFTSMQLRLNPDRLDDAAIAAVKDKIQRSGIYVSSLAVDGNHIDPDPARRARQNEYAAKCIELCGKLGIPNIGGQSGTIKGQPLNAQVDEIVRVYTEKYFPLCEKYKAVSYTHLDVYKRQDQNRTLAIMPAQRVESFQGILRLLGDSAQ